MSENGRIVWTNERRRVGDLKPWDINPRKINKAERERLGESFDDFGQVETLAIGPENELYNGHQRLDYLIEKHGADYEVDVRAADRKLTEQERKKLTVLLHKGTIAEWNREILFDVFDLEDLTDWGFEDYELGIEPTEDEWNRAFGALPTEDRAPFQQMTFTVHDDQAEIIKDALKKAKLSNDYSGSPNTNSNGNSLAAICKKYNG